MVPSHPMAPTHSLTAWPTPGQGKPPLLTTWPPLHLNAATTPRKWHGRPLRMPGDKVSAAAEPICNKNLFWLVQRHPERRKAKMAAATTPAAPGKQLSKRQAPASHRDKEPAKPTWKPKPLPKFHPDNFVVVLKP
ncbi:hypothetical protein HPB48_017258 [Haemaphysalis longicornis]|uniref:Uncharacterized protein n=1 Tax=Haemaphysalis longicornis TaxID=44386 RepID=A0A9J6GK03_HAELO|nr:hypothetical protein HPB48_017258 [Haemaphysalis longicornis]